VRGTVEPLSRVLGVEKLIWPPVNPSSSSVVWAKGCRTKHATTECPASWQARNHGSSGSCSQGGSGLPRHSSCPHFEKYLFLFCSFRARWSRRAPSTAGHPTLIHAVAQSGRAITRSASKWLRDWKPRRCRGPVGAQKAQTRDRLVARGTAHTSWA